VQGHSDIWVAPLRDWQRAKPITTGGASAHPSWTFDDKVVYEHYEGRLTRVIMLEPDGTSSRQLAIADESAHNLRLSPDNRYLVFVSYKTGAPHLWRSDLDGNNIVQLTNSNWDNGTDQPDFSPDGKWVFYSKLGAERGLWKVPIAGGDPVQLVASHDMALGPRVSPDGRMLAYRYRDKTATPIVGVAIFPLEKDSVQKRLDIDIPSEAYGWSIDSHAILYAKAEQGVSNVWNWPISGEPPTQITYFNNEFIWNLDLSRDGKQLVMDRGTSSSDVVLIRDLK
jgi:Tol biopolymer transport system component